MVPFVHPKLMQKVGPKFRAQIKAEIISMRLDQVAFESVA